MSIINENVPCVSATFPLILLLLDACVFWDVGIVGGDYAEHVLLAEHGVMGIVHVVVLVERSVVVVFKWKNFHQLVIIIFVFYSSFFGLGLADLVDLFYAILVWCLLFHCKLNPLWLFGLETGLLFRPFRYILSLKFGALITHRLV